MLMALELRNKSSGFWLFSLQGNEFGWTFPGKHAFGYISCGLKMSKIILAIPLLALYNSIKITHEGKECVLPNQWDKLPFETLFTTFSEPIRI